MLNVSSFPTLTSKEIWPLSKGYSTHGITPTPVTITPTIEENLCFATSDTTIASSK
jgi:hypothetical protein